LVEAVVYAPEGTLITLHVCPVMRLDSLCCVAADYDTKPASMDDREVLEDRMYELCFTVAIKIVFLKRL